MNRPLGDTRYIRPPSLPRTINITLSHHHSLTAPPLTPPLTAPPLLPSSPHTTHPFTHYPHTITLKPPPSTITPLHHHPSHHHSQTTTPHTITSSHHHPQTTTPPPPLPCTITSSHHHPQTTTPPPSHSTPNTITSTSAIPYSVETAKFAHFISQNFTAHIH